MPFVAILVVRAVVQVPWPRPRVATALAVALLGLHHWIGCTFTFDTSFQSPGVTFQGSTPGMHVASLVNHRSFYLDWAKSGGADATLDYKVPETLDRVVDMRLLPGSSIAYFGEHVFISASSFQLENERRGLHFGFWNPPGLRTSDRPGWLEEHERALTQASAVILRSNRPEDGVSTAYTELFHSLNDGVKFDFAPMGEPLTLGDGSVLFFYRCRPRKDPAVTRLGAGG
jgi:hypothetical protein